MYIINSNYEKNSGMPWGKSVIVSKYPHIVRWANNTHLVRSLTRSMMTATCGNEAPAAPALRCSLQWQKKLQSILKLSTLRGILQNLQPLPAGTPPQC